MSFLFITNQTQFEPVLTFSYVSHVLIALLLSLSAHATLFFAWHHLQALPVLPIIVHGELLPPVIMDSPERIESLPALPPIEKKPLAPVHKQELPIPKHESREQKTKQVADSAPKKKSKLVSNSAPQKVSQQVPQKAPQQPPQQVIDTGVALPLMTEKADTANTDANDYVVPEVQPIAADDKIPFASKPGETPLEQYTPSKPTSSESNKVVTTYNARESRENNEKMPDSGALDEYVKGLGERAQQLISYPTLAQYRGWEGTVEVLVKYDRNGVAYQISVNDSSGQKILDSQALKTVKKACVDFVLPAKLVGKAFSVIVPVKFVLKN